MNICKVIVFIALGLAPRVGRTQMRFFFYGVETGSARNFQGQEPEQLHLAQLTEIDGKLFALFDAPIRLRDRIRPEQSAVVDRIELGPGPANMYWDILRLLDTVGEEELVVFPAEGPGPSRELTRTDAPSFRTAENLPAVTSSRLMPAFRKLSYIIVDVDLDHVSRGVLMTPTLRLMFEQVYSGDGATDFFGLERSSLQLDLDALATSFNRLKILSLRDPNVQAFLGMTFHAKVEAEMRAPWGNLLRERLIVGRADLNDRLERPECRLLLDGDSGKTL